MRSERVQLIPLPFASKLPPLLSTTADPLAMVGFLLRHLGVDSFEGNKMTIISRLNFNAWNRCGERLQSGHPIGKRLVHSLSPVYHGVNLDVLKTCNL